MKFSNGVVFNLSDNIVSVHTDTICIEFGFSIASVVNSFKLIKTTIESDLKSFRNYLINNSISINDADKILSEVRS